MPNIRLVAVDEDGTFLRDHIHYDNERFGRLFDRMQALGVRFVVATGNQRYQVESLFSEYANRMGIVSASGAYVVDGGDEVFVAHASDKAVARMIDICHDVRDVPFAFIGVRCTYVERGTDQAFFDDMSLYSTRIEWVEDFRDVDDKIIMFSSLVDENRVKSEIERFRETVGDFMDVTGSGGGYFDVMCPGINKAVGLRHLLDRHGIRPEECVAFGDSDNDLEMLEFVGLGYAMQDAPENVKAVADRIAPPCAEDGVLQVLEDLLF
ncbi:MAG: HAD family hydrolase [Atopobiaceae bacterium]|nr:HAD family hydrolase [Atopobiaceae bacterium]